MNLKHKPTKVFICGMSGCGKSTFYTRYVNNIQADKIFIFDHELEFALRNNLDAVTELTSEYILSNRYIVYDPAVQFPGEVESAFNYYADLVFQVSTILPGKKLFACDEMQKIVSTDYVSKELSTLIETGRRYEIDTVFCAQQLNIIHNRLRNQMTEIVSFAHVDVRAIAPLEDIGFSEDAIRELGEHEFIHRNMRYSTETRGRLSFAEKSVDTIPQAVPSSQLDPEFRSDEETRPEPESMEN